MSEAAKRCGVALLALALPGSALALPWNLDMADSAAVKAYEREMAPLPEGVMSQPHVLTPISYRRNFSWQSDARLTLQNPLEADDAVLATGRRMYEVYCTPCHGDGEVLGPVSEKGYPAVAILAGDKGRLKNLPDGHVYLTIRNGSISTLMPAYGYAMTNDEMWSLVAWMRDALPQSAYLPPETTPAATAEDVR
ncbi:MAG: c-type cytochrome [Alphaproteobacteria bacterium]|nr:c-type cytochrome [Alphaproteobacteria bacterium]